MYPGNPASIDKPLKQEVDFLTSLQASNAFFDTGNFQINFTPFLHGFIRFLRSNAGLFKCQMFEFIPQVFLLLLRRLNAINRCDKKWLKRGRDSHRSIRLFIRDPVKQPLFHVHLSVRSGMRKSMHLKTMSAVFLIAQRKSHAFITKCLIQLLILFPQKLEDLAPPGLSEGLESRFKHCRMVDLTYVSVN